MIELSTARKHVKQMIGDSPVHYRITFNHKIMDGLFFTLDFWFEEKRLVFGLFADDSYDFRRF